MTCIVGIEHDGKVYMGGDSAGASGWDIKNISCKKVFVKDHLIIGYTWSWRMGQIIEFAEDIPCLTDEFKKDGYAYLVKSFVPYIRKLFKDEGFSTIKDNFETGGNFLVGINGKLYEIQQDFSVLRSTDGFAAVGCGANYALGAMGILKDQFNHGSLKF
jgi:ATP-dependent protease HslVU (ClpYQ) peptidase subunit